ncbi:ABC transporter permease [Dactylosporangium roseum]|uniref:ABC transporter permease n=1 Tax=Dactylosporangium roseum TaxID=47989 RepID=A0ABY5ZAT3_9ACTN|nr:ABC transporter permease [Dactylosporangium roseum]UWZ39188.1 ABC transporter permease [Dactylosporangium roseum]
MPRTVAESAPGTAVAAGAVAPAAHTRRARTRRKWLGLALAIAGVALLFLAVLPAANLSAGPRWLIGFAGLFAWFRGTDRAAKAHFGPQFQTGLWLAAFWTGIIVLLAVIAPLLPLQSPTHLPLDTSSWISADLFGEYVLGTDANGRDVLSRIINGAQVSLILGIGSAAIGVVVGMTIGILGAHYGGLLDAIIRVVTDSLLSFPPLVLLLALVAVLKPTYGTLFLAFSFFVVPSMVRLSRGTAARLAAREYVLAAKALGARGPRIMVRELLPGVARVLLPFSGVIVAALIIAAASLSFLGLGVPPPAPTWGGMISEAQDVLQKHPQGVLIPSIVLFITVMAFNRLGEGARAATDTRESVLG